MQTGNSAEELFAFQAISAALISGLCGLWQVLANLQSAEQAAGPTAQLNPPTTPR